MNVDLTLCKFCFESKSKHVPYQNTNYFYICNDGKDGTTEWSPITFYVPMTNLELIEYYGKDRSNSL